VILFKEKIDNLLFIEFLVFPISSYRRVFDPFDYESYEISKAYLLGKIAKTPFYWKSEKSNELLGLIHTNIYEPIMILLWMDIHVWSVMTILDMIMCIWWKSQSFERFKEFR